MLSYTVTSALENDSSFESSAIGESVSRQASLPQTTTSRLVSSLSKTFLNHEFADIRIHALSTDFYLHKVILVSNPYFRQILTGSWKETETFKKALWLTSTPVKTAMESHVKELSHVSLSSPLLSQRASVLLHERVKSMGDRSSLHDMTLHFDDPNITVESLTIVFGRLYGRMDYRIHANNVFHVLAAAVFFDDPDLCLACQEVAQSQVLSNPSVIIEYMIFLDQFYYGSYSDAILRSCLQQVCQLSAIYLPTGGRTNETISSSSDASVSLETVQRIFISMPVSWLERIIVSNWFFAPTEYDRYLFVREIIRARKTRHEQLKHKASQETLKSLTPTIAASPVLSAKNLVTVPGQAIEDSKYGMDLLMEDVPDLDASLVDLDGDADLPDSPAPLSSQSQYRSLHVEDEPIRKTNNTDVSDESDSRTIYASSPSLDSHIELLDDVYEEIAAYERILTHGLLYANMSFEELLRVKEDGLVPSHVLEKAVWNQREFQHVIGNTPGLSSCLGLDCLKHAIPKDDTDRIVDRNILNELTVETEQQDEDMDRIEKGVYLYRGLKHVPIRFSVEFKNLKSILGMAETKLYSSPIIYAGSKWKVYVQVMSEETDKLGLYVQRLPMDTVTPTTSMSRPRGDTSVNSAWDIDRRIHPNNDLHPAAHVTTSPTSPVTKSTPINSNTTPPFIDPRRVTETWFQLHCFMGDACYKLESKPDVFKVYQSWGWRSLKLYRDAFQSGQETPSLRITVVMGHI